MERDLAACLSEFSRAWKFFEGGCMPTPERLIELTVESAWNSGHAYWTRLSVPWVIEMAKHSNFDHELVRKLLGDMAHSKV